MTIVTISRGSFSGGIAVAGLVAERLCVPCISREEVRDAAHAADGVRESPGATLDEPPRFWQKTPGKLPAHLNRLRARMLEQAPAGEFVYHGQAGQLLLGGVDHVLRVRVDAGEEYRVRTAMADFGLDEDEARRYVKTVNGQLKKWTRFLYGVDWEDPLLYDVVLRVDRVGVEGTADTIVHMTELPQFCPTDESRKSYADLALSTRVWEALSDDAHTRSANVRVAADGAAVFVTGSADGGKVVEAIDAVAATVPGVASVTNEVTLGGHWQW
jgi:osmotically-inducible protein OsmY